ncbi:MAG: phosphoglucosamine mutase [Thermoleophilia bacterium]|nr:phosphoglucosamine mutase [Thermoleophilia bacterium]
MRSGGQGFDLQQPPRRWFGTDGIRGVANVDLTPELALVAGRSVAEVLALRSESGAGGVRSGIRLLVGRDTRRSGPMLEAALAAGVASAGGAAVLAGVLPTPGVSRLVTAGEFQGGVVISASHNPFRDNGIKLFGPDGRKLPDSVELEVEARMQGEHSGTDEVGSVEALTAAVPTYVEDLVGSLAVDLTGLRVLLDCAHGATYQAAPLAFTMAGAVTETVCVEPDGENINAACGSTDLAYLASRVAQGDYDLGLAFDGDGDRVLAVDRAGRVVDGDQIMAVLALWLHERGRLARGTVVVTSMSNLGFHRAMREHGLTVEITDVGDRYVLERMEQVGAVLGGEQSGHVIYLDAGATGDGLQTALLLGNVLRESQRSLAELARVVHHFPQLLLNVRVRDKGKLGGAAALWEAVAAEQAALAEEGRIVLRPSGTEPLVRIMVEAPTEERCREVAERLAGVVERSLG